MAAFRAKRLDCSAISLTVEIISPMAWVFSLRVTIFCATCSTCTRMDSMMARVSSTALIPTSLAELVASAAWATCFALSDTWYPVSLISSMVELVSWMAVACSFMLPDCCWMAARISADVELIFLTAFMVWLLNCLRSAVICLKHAFKWPISSLDVLIS